MDESRFKPMVDIIAHRGPDDAGYLVWHTGIHDIRSTSYGQGFTDEKYRANCPLLPPIDSEFGRTKLQDDTWDIFLGHRRLSILDLSPRGHQPMSDRAQLIWVVYNGEIYNFQELRNELECGGHRFTSKSDTEVLIHAYEEWGIECVKKLNGMFAFAIWDVRQRSLRLARDRYGIKPLYVFNDGSTFLFGSEIKAVLAYLNKFPGVDVRALNEYFSFQNILSERTLFSGISLLKPGHHMTVDLRTVHVTTEQYWDFDFSQQENRSQTEVQQGLSRRFLQAVKKQCISDVLIGSYLSGGIDSGAVTAATRRELGRIYTFTAGFDLSEAAAHEMSFDEREIAEGLSSSLQTEHYECVLHSGDMEAVMPDLIWHLEDLRVGQCYPNYYVARLASRFVKVVMSGIGGDELFGGYPWRYAAALGESNNDYVKNYYTYWQRLVTDTEKQAFFDPDVEKRFATINDNDSMSFCSHTLSVFREVLGDGVEVTNVNDQVNYSLYFECKTFLHGLLLVEDKLSMANSLETRVPFLENDLVDFACRIPVRLKVANLDQLQRLDENFPRKKTLWQGQGNSGKNILRKAMEEILPEEFTTKRKQGFCAPDESWFRGTSEKYVRHTLGDDALINEFINPAYVRNVLDIHMSGQANKRLLIWSLICFNNWLKIFVHDSFKNVHH